MLDHDLHLERVAALDGDAGTSETATFSRKDYAALAEDAAGFAACNKEAAASMATLFRAVCQLAGGNQLVRELAEIGEAMADDLKETADDTCIRYTLEGKRYG